MKRMILLLALLLVCTPAFAAGWSKGCSFSGTATLTGIVGTPDQGVVVTASTTLPAVPPAPLSDVGPGSVLCYRWVDTTDANPHNAGPFRVSAAEAYILFDPQLDAVVSAPTAAVVIPHLCAGGLLTLTAPQLACPSMGGMNGNPSLTGVGGPDSLQNAVKWIGPGLYYLEIPAAGGCLAGDTCQVMIRGVR